MALKERIESDLKIALLGGDRFATEVLRGLKAVVLNEEVAQNKRETGLDDATIERLIAKEVKKRHESAAIYQQNNRPELGDSEQKEATILEKYLPEQIGETELSEIIVKTIDELGASGVQATGQVIGAVKKRVGNQADGATIARLVQQKLK